MNSARRRVIWLYFFLLGVEQNDAFLNQNMLFYLNETMLFWPS